MHTLIIIFLAVLGYIGFPWGISMVMTLILKYCIHRSTHNTHAEDSSPVNSEGAPPEYSRYDPLNGGSFSMNSEEIPPKYARTDPNPSSPDCVDVSDNYPLAYKNGAPEASAPSYDKLFPQSDEKANCPKASAPPY